MVVSAFERRSHLYCCSHTFQVWNGRCFERVRLSDLGLSLQLGHNGMACPCPSITSSITVVNTMGLHNVKLNYCECAPSIPRYQQLLRAGLFPATEKRPSTTISFAFLETYSKLSQTAKTNLYDFYMFILARADPLHLHHSIVSAIIYYPQALTYAHFTAAFTLRAGFAGCSYVEGPHRAETRRTRP
jgi:hypothetical protein